MKPGQGCWTCKGRKIGCDRKLPACGNCIRTGRQCLGYGVRLAWPDKHDGRRKTQELSIADIYFLPHSPKDSAWHFLNVDAKDIANAPSRPNVQPTSRCPRPLPWWPSLEAEPGALLSYYEDRISRMISTIDIENGFRTELLPWALSQSGESFTALRNAILAVSALHKFGASAAMPFKSKALRSLSQSFSTDEASESSGAAHAQLATSMMLCVYSVFDETEGNWHLHLNGAKGIIERSGTNSSFLWTWFLYHEVLGAFSRPYIESSKKQSSFIPPVKSTFSESSLIIGSLGCSLELLEAIRCINFIRDADPKPPDYVEVCSRLETQLLNLAQRIPPDENEKSVHTVAQQAQILGTADLYRMAALLYLRRVSPAQEVGETDPLPAFVAEAYKVLRSLEIWTSPWPIFVLACEAETDAHRMAILTALQDMDERRGIGNVFVLRNIIESLWKQRDLKADTGQPWAFEWWDPNNIDTVTPWFI